MPLGAEVERLDAELQLDVLQPQLPINLLDLLLFFVQQVADAQIRLAEIPQVLPVHHDPQAVHLLLALVKPVPQFHGYVVHNLLDKAEAKDGGFRVVNGELQRAFVQSHHLQKLPVLHLPQLLLLRLCDAIGCQFITRTTLLPQLCDDVRQKGGVPVAPHVLPKLRLRGLIRTGLFRVLLGIGGPLLQCLHILGIRSNNAVMHTGQICLTSAAQAAKRLLQSTGLFVAFCRGAKHVCEQPDLFFLRCDHLELVTHQLHQLLHRCNDGIGCLLRHGHIPILQCLGLQLLDLLHPLVLVCHGVVSLVQRLCW
mmetsp:Transcript_11875/g.21803  ORF Transcript_11875/g.21803 Transcript_11875/m.21803 type:complete len:310 (+) Transcript_11875:2183-3112(+)